MDTLTVSPSSGYRQLLENLNGVEHGLIFKDRVADNPIIGRVLNSPVFHFVTVVWGEAFVRQFLELALPSFLAEGNFGHCVSHRSDRYFIYTTLEYSDSIRKSPEFRKLSELLNVELRTLEDTTPGEDGLRPHYCESWKVVNRAYAEVVRGAIEADACVFLLEPDGVWSDGSFRNFREIMGTGKKVILVSGCSTDPVGMRAALRDGYFDEAACRIAIPSRELVRTAMEHFHFYSKHHFWNSESYFNRGPGHLHWRVENEGILARYFNVGNNVIKFPKTPPEIPIQGGGELMSFLQECFPDEEAFYCLQDSDVAFMAGLESALPGDADFKIKPSEISDRGSLIRVAAWMGGNVDRINRFIADKPIRWHFTECSERWEHYEKESGEVLKSLYTCCRFMERHPELKGDLREQIHSLDRVKEEAWLLKASEQQIEELLLKGQESASWKLYQTHEYFARKSIGHGDTERLLKHYDQMVVCDPESAKAFAVDAARTFESQGMPAQAVVFMEGALKSFEKSYPSSA